MRGLVELPMEKGRKELAWMVGTATVNGSSTLLTPTVPLKVERDADFVLKRWWLVQWPQSAAALSLPAGTTVTLRDGGTKRALAPVAAGSQVIIPDATAAFFTGMAMGLACPFLIRANNSLFAEVTAPNPTTWTGDLYLVAEGFKVYPYLPEEFPATIKEYAIPFDLAGSVSLPNPNLSTANATAQSLKLTATGDGKLLLKSMQIQIIDGAGLDKTSALLPYLAINMIDSTSGNKLWCQNTLGGSQQSQVPAIIPTMGNVFLPWCAPRYLDPNGVINTQFYWTTQAAQLTTLSSLVTWPVTAYVTFKGAMLPR